ncbi:MAG: YciI family protein [Maribacter sp.]
MMKKEENFMMIFRFTPNAEHQPTQQEQNQMKELWGNFIGSIALKEKLVSTNQLGSNGQQIQHDLSTSKGILISENRIVGGNMIVKANSLDEATEMAKDCPILKMGGTIEVRNIVPMN